MITISLATIVSYLTRKGMDLACLEGAPRTWVGTKDRLLGITRADLDLIPIMGSWPPDTSLYLGRDSVCPAAMGWAQRLLSAARGPNSDAVWMGTLRVELWTIGCEEADHRWMWDKTIIAADEAPERTYLPGIAPATPAARLRAVLEYEMGRDQ